MEAEKADQGDILAAYESIRAEGQPDEFDSPRCTAETNQEIKVFTLGKDGRDDDEELGKVIKENVYRKTPAFCDRLKSYEKQNQPMSLQQMQCSFWSAQQHPMQDTTNIMPPLNKNNNNTNNQINSQIKQHQWIDFPAKSNINFQDGTSTSQKLLETAYSTTNSLPFESDNIKKYYLNRADSIIAQLLNPSQDLTQNQRQEESIDQIISTCLERSNKLLSQATDCATKTTLNRVIKEEKQKRKAQMKQELYQTLSRSQLFVDQYPQANICTNVKQQIIY